jgi:hypothetical protein
MSLRRPVLSVPLLSLVLTAALATVAAPAYADATSSAAASKKHCVLDAGSATPACYATFPAAISAATRGLVKAPATPAAAAADPSFATELAAAGTQAATWVVGVEWTNASWTGTSLTLRASGPCDNSLDADYVWNTLPAGWNDVITSFRSYNNCAQQLFRNTYRGGGSLTGILTSTPNVGAPANDQASSLTAN